MFLFFLCPFRVGKLFTRMQWEISVSVMEGSCISGWVPLPKCRGRPQQGPVISQYCLQRVARDAVLGMTNYISGKKNVSLFPMFVLQF